MRWRVIYLITFLCFIAAYQYNIKKSVEAYSSYKQVKDDIAKIPQLDDTQVDSLPDIGVLRKKNPGLLKFISEYCDSSDISLREFSQTSSSGKDSIRIQTNKVTISGDYMKTLYLVYNIEITNKVAINSVEWIYNKTEKSMGTVSPILMTLYTKNELNEK